MLKPLIDYFFKDDQSKKETATKLVTAAITIVATVLAVLQQVAAALQ